MKYNTLLLQNGTFPQINTDNIEIELELEYEKYTNICLSLFKWENLPNNINPTFLERTLFTHGRGMFVNDSEKGFMFVPCVPSKDLNYQDEPLFYKSTATNYTKEYNKEDIILLRNNPLEIPNELMIINYCKKLSECSNIARINLYAQRTPVLIVCDDKDILTMKNLYKKFEGDTPVIFGDKTLNYENLKVLKTDAPFVVDKIADYKTVLRNELLTNLGIDNSNTDKKERLITDEVNSNNAEIEINKNVMLTERVKACKMINKKFNLNVKVSWNFDNDMEGDEENE